MTSTYLDELLADDGPLALEMRKERTPAELLDWIDRLHDELSFFKEDRKRIRLAAGPIKLLFEEVRPLALFGTWLAKDHPQLTVQPLVSKGPTRDGILRCPHWASPREIEVTFAKNGYHENLRMLHLNRFGRAPALGEISFIRKEGRPQPVVTPMTAHDVRKTRANTYTLIRYAAEKKQQKQYPSDTWLLIVFDDNFGFRDSNAVAEFQEFFEGNVLKLPWQIDGVFAVGTSGRIVAGSRVTKS